MEPLRLAEELLLALFAEHAIGLEHVDHDPGTLRGCLSQEPGILTLASPLYRLAGERDRSRTRELLERLSASDLDCDSLHLETIAELQRTVGFDRWCW